MHTFQEALLLIYSLVKAEYIENVELLKHLQTSISFLVWEKLTCRIEIHAEGQPRTLLQRQRHILPSQTAASESREELYCSACGATWLHMLLGHRSTPSINNQQRSASSSAPTWPCRLRSIVHGPRFITSAYSGDHWLPGNYAWTAQICTGQGSQPHVPCMSVPQ